MLTGPSATESIDERLDVLASQPFRARFHLRGRERSLVQPVDVIMRWIEHELPGAPR
jgi:hypothetical protein